jgi:putative ATPase
VFVLEPLRPDDIERIVRRALTADSKARGRPGPAALGDDAVGALVEHAQGDARRALNGLEAVLLLLQSLSPPPEPVSREVVARLLEKPLPVHDKAGESHYNIISAFHKAVRGSDVEASLYWLARMLVAGEDPVYVVRRIVRIAAEDVGLADPRALSVALAAKDAYHFLGSPEGDLAIAEAAVYLATAPKSNRVYEAFGRAVEAAERHPAEPVPLHLRNAPTGLMRRLGYGAGYQYGHADPTGYVAQEYLPEALRGARWYEPVERGYEKTIKERLAWWSDLKGRAADEGSDPPSAEGGR